jgi:hypothetical protein
MFILFMDRKGMLLTHAVPCGQTHYRHASANYHVYKHNKGFVYFNYTYRLLFIALFDDFNLIISIVIVYVHHFDKK